MQSFDHRTCAITHKIFMQSFSLLRSFWVPAAMQLGVLKTESTRGLETRILTFYCVSATSF